MTGESLRVIHAKALASAPNFTSSLQVTASGELNGSLVKCANNLMHNINEEAIS